MMWSGEGEKKKNSKSHISIDLILGFWGRLIPSCEWAHNVGSHGLKMIYWMQCGGEAHLQVYTGLP